MEEEEEIELGEANPEDMKSKDSGEEMEEESEQSSEEESVPIKKKKMVFPATDIRKAVIKTGKSMNKIYHYISRN